MRSLMQASYFPAARSHYYMHMYARVNSPSIKTLNLLKDADQGSFLYHGTKMEWIVGCMTCGLTGDWLSMADCLGSW